MYTIIISLLFSFIAFADVSEFNFTITDKQADLLQWALEQKSDNTPEEINLETVKKYEQQNNIDNADYKYFGLYSHGAEKGKETKIICKKHYCEIKLFKKPEQKGVFASIAESAKGISNSALCLVMDRSCDSVSQSDKKTESLEAVEIASLKLTKNDLSKLTKSLEKHKSEDDLLSNLLTSRISKTTVGRRDYTCKYLTVYEDQPGTHSCYTTVHLTTGKLITSKQKQLKTSSKSLLENTNPFMVGAPHSESRKSEGIR